MIEYRKNGYLCDAIVEANDQTMFKVHKIILAGSSPYFEKLFQWKEGSQEFPRAKVPFEGKSVETVIDWIYQREIDLPDAVDAMNFLRTATYLELPELQETCTKIVIDSVTGENVFPIWKMSREGESSSAGYGNVISDFCLDFATSNFHLLIGTHVADYLCLPDEIFTSLLETDRLITASEEEVLDLARLKASDADFSEQQRLDLLKKVRLPLMRREGVLDQKLERIRHIQSVSCVAQSALTEAGPNFPKRDPISTLFMLVEKYHQRGIVILEWSTRDEEVIERKAFEYNEHAYVRNCSDTLYRGREIVMMVVKAHGQALYSNHMLAIDVLTWKERELPGIAQRVVNPLRIVAVEDDIFCFHDEFHRNADDMGNFQQLIFISSYNDSKKLWTTKKVLSLPRAMSPTIFTIKNDIYVMLDTEFKKFNKATWTFQGYAEIPGPIQRRYFRWCIWNEKLVICGGCHHEPFATFLRTCYVVDLEKMTIHGEDIADLPTATTARPTCVSQCDDGLVAWHYDHANHFSQLGRHLASLQYCPDLKEWRPRIPKMNGLPLQNIFLARVVTVPQKLLGPRKQRTDHVISSASVRQALRATCVASLVATALSEAFLACK